MIQVVTNNNSNPSNSIHTKGWSTYEDEEQEEEDPSIIVLATKKGNRIELNVRTH